MSRYSIDSIIITHAMTIGFLGFVMLGSMTQMLPVLAVTTYSHILLVVGSIFMF